MSETHCGRASFWIKINELFRKISEIPLIRITLKGGMLFIKSKFFLKMKLTAFFLMIAAMHASANGFSQRVTMSENNVSLKKVIEKMARQTGVSIMYDNSLIDADTRVSINVKDVPLQDALDQCLTSRDFTFSIIDNTVVIRKLDKSPMMAPTAVLVDISGYVTDEKSQPLQGVTVSIKGKRAVTSTDAKGYFAIKADPTDELEFTIIGYKSTIVKITAGEQLNVVLQSDFNNLNDVVVIGYGSKTRGTVTGAVSTIGAAALADRPTGNTTDLLQGVAPGFNVTRANSGRVANQGTAINIRGPISRSDPGVLIVVDGIPQVDNNANALDNLNPNDIENISILKDAQAAIYGARAAGGVILVTTKRGRSDKPMINVSANYTYQKPALGKKSVNVLQLIEMMDEAFTNDGQAVNKYSGPHQYIKDNNITFDDVKRNDKKYFVPFDNSFGYYLGHYDWVDIIYDPSLMQNYNVSVSGRTERSNYFNSVGIVDQPSILSHGPNSNKKYFARLKYDYNLTDWLKVNLNFSLENQKVQEPSDYGSLEFWMGLIWPVYMPYNDAGHLYHWGSHANALGYLTDAGQNKVDAYRVRGQVGATITPFKNFSINTDFSAAYDIRESDSAVLGFDMYDENDANVVNTTGGINSAGASYARSRYYVGNLYAQYHIGAGDHSVDLMAGTSHEEFDYRDFYTYRNLGLINPSLPTFGVGAADQQFNGERKFQSAINSFFGRLNYSFANKYLVEGTFRYDGSSKFAKGYQWKPFYGISAGWVITNEDFMTRARSTLNNLKLRASWGQVGNQSSIGYFDYVPQINLTGGIGGIGYPLGSVTAPTQTLGAYVANLSSNNRTWETVETKNIGLDFAFLNSRLGGTVDYFIRDDANMFYTKDFPQVLGTLVPDFSGQLGGIGTVAPSINGAHVRTKGFELSLGWKDQVGAVSYNIGVNYSNSTTKVLDLADSRIPGMGLGTTYIEGFPVASMFGYEYDGIIKDEADLAAYTSRITSGIPNNLKPGDAKYKDLDGDGALVPQLFDPAKGTVSGDMKYLGNNTQHNLFGVTLGATWKNFDLNIFLQGVMGWRQHESNYAFIFDSWPSLSYFYGNTWTPTHTDAKYPRLSADYGIRDNNYVYSDAPYIDINEKYIRLKNLQIGYNFSKSLISRIRLTNARLFFTGFDIWEWDNLPGDKQYDPEKPFNPYISPMIRRYSLGLNVTL